MSDNFDLGQQPCTAFRPAQTITEHGAWDNRHSCCGPQIRHEKKECSALVSYCDNCHRDHHEGGYETCPQEAER